MSLDFVLLGVDGRPEASVSIGVDLHHALMTTVAGLGMTGFNVFADYYEDAEIGADDLPCFVGEIEAMAPLIESDSLRQFLDKLLVLARRALSEGRSLYAIAD